MISPSERVITGRRMLDEAQSLRTSIVAAQEIQRFLRDCARFAEPIQHEGRSAMKILEWFQAPPVHGTRQPIPLYIFPLYSSDAQISDDWARYVAAPAPAFYSAAMHAIILRPELYETAFERACTLIHEGGHALRALRAGRYGPVGGAQTRPDEQYFAEECEMHELEGGLWRERGTAAYENAVKCGLVWLTEVINNQREQPGEAVYCIPFDTLGVEPILAKFLGEPPSDQARRCRLMLLNTLVHFRAIEQQYDRAEAQLRKARLMAAIHETVGLPRQL